MWEKEEWTIDLIRDARKSGNAIPTDVAKIISWLDRIYLILAWQEDTDSERTLVQWYIRASLEWFSSWEDMTPELWEEGGKQLMKQLNAMELARQLWLTADLRRRKPNRV